MVAFIRKGKKNTSRERERLGGFLFLDFSSRKFPSEKIMTCVPHEIAIVCIYSLSCGKRKKKKKKKNGLRMRRSVVVVVAK